MDECKSSNRDGSNEFDDLFDQCVGDLESNGYALMPLSTLLQSSERASSVAQAFETARSALDAVSQNQDAAPLIDPSTDSGSWTGYHDAAVVNGRYNQYRQGFVFSHGDMFDVMMDREGNNNFQDEMSAFFGVMHDDVANGTLRAIERRLELPHLYFDHEFGPTNSSSQWHMKRYDVDVQSNSCGDEGGQDAPNADALVPSKSQKESDIFLPAHTDPSLISVVILDQAGKNKGGMGLEVFHPPKTRENPGTWKEISHHGHDVAVVFVGSVLSYLTKGQVLSAAKHRVVNWVSSHAEAECDAARMAATLFVRPSGDALMKSLPSPYFQINDATKKQPPTFRAWNLRVAKNYMKKKKQSNLI